MSYGIDYIIYGYAGGGDDGTDLHAGTRKSSPKIDCLHLRYHFPS